jgi:hypothetical protein
MAGAEKDEMNKIRTALSNTSDEKGNKAVNGIDRDDQGVVRIEHRPSASDEIDDRMDDIGYDRREQLSETNAQAEADADPGHVVTIFERT